MKKWKNSDLGDFEWGVVVGAVFQKLLIFLDSSHTTISCLRKRKHPVSSSSLGENVLLMCDENEQTAMKKQEGNSKSFLTGFSVHCTHMYFIPASFSCMTTIN